MKKICHAVHSCTYVHFLRGKFLFLISERFFCSFLLSLLINEMLHSLFWVFFLYFLFGYSFLMIVTVKLLPL